MEKNSEFSFNILIIDDEINIRKTLSMALELEGHRVTSVSNGSDGLTQIGLKPVDIVFLDLRLGSEKGTDYIPKILALNSRIKIVMITAYATIETAVEAVKRGATEYLPKPFTPAQVNEIILRFAEMKKFEDLGKRLENSNNGIEPALDLDSKNLAMQKMIDIARQVAPTEASVLLRGESGTGKSRMAKLIHEWSARAHKPFGIISCPSLSPELFESELFGHIRGAFTGALKDQPGRITAHNGGTLFLDEIGDLPIQVQPKLLRLLQEKQYERVGENLTRTADIRIITATNLDLEAMVKAGKFREDLFYRLNTFQIEIPPLRERREDIPPLTQHYLTFYASQNHRPFLEFSQEAISKMQSYPWPGNIRELKNTIEKAVILCKGTQIGISDLDFKSSTEKLPVYSAENLPLEKVEEAHIRHILASVKSLDEAARILGIDVATLWRRRKKYGI